jgi:hypothetical protein
MTRPQRQHQRRAQHRVLHINHGPALQEHLDRVAPSVTGHQPQRRVSAIVERVHVRQTGDRLAHRVRIVTGSGGAQRLRARLRPRAPLDKHSGHEQDRDQHAQH